jgi:hypothetical protein
MAAFVPKAVKLEILPPRVRKRDRLPGGPAMIQRGNSCQSDGCRDGQYPG